AVNWFSRGGVVLAAATVAACAGRPDQAATATAAALPTWTWDSTLVFPADRSLTRPEDGVALPDGRLLVSDQATGLRVIASDGTNQPFGNLAAAGYTHNPPAHNGGANGVSLEPDGKHLLLADVFGGAIYRVDVSTGETEKVYQHRYGINTAVRDSRGAIWFTQSAHNTPADGEPRLWASVDVVRPEGALYRLGMKDGHLAAEAELLVDSLRFANGLAIDEARGNLYLSETTGGRVLRYHVDLDAGTVSGRAVFADSVAADNIELDGEGHLWMAVPLSNELLVANTVTGERRAAFQAQTSEQQKVVEEFARRGVAGTSRMELFTPAAWAPLPGPITGVILAPHGGPVYVTGLGNALLKLAR
ncbi:MAG TPA: SMP-30/gluconolactonase/LRE family protein, partial [Gemmatimonadales bacterium]|nr:SMP-30/gluconolactonase/LRE family protein [Gemmatimonadales bacterium]